MSQETKEELKKDVQDMADLIPEPKACHGCGNTGVSYISFPYDTKPDPDDPKKTLKVIICFDCYLYPFLNHKKLKRLVG